MASAPQGWDAVVGTVARCTSVPLVAIRAILVDVQEVEVVVAHHERATLRVGEVFLKIEADQARTDVEVAAMLLAPIPTPQVLWRRPPVLAMAALRGAALGRLDRLRVGLGRGGGDRAEVA